MGDAFAPLLPQILPNLFNLLNNVFVPQPQDASVQDFTANYQTYDTEEATIAINMLSVIIDEIGGHFSEQDMQNTLKIIVPLCNHATNFEIRKSSVTCLSGCVKATFARNPL